MGRVDPDMRMYLDSRVYHRRAHSGALGACFHLCASVVLISEFSAVLLGPALDHLVDLDRMVHVRLVGRAVAVRPRSARG